MTLEVETAWPGDRRGSPRRRDRTGAAVLPAAPAVARGRVAGGRIRRRRYGGLVLREAQGALQVSPDGRAFEPVRELGAHVMRPPGSGSSGSTVAFPP